jgi:hypothetical protein
VGLRVGKGSNGDVYDYMFLFDLQKENGHLRRWFPWGWGWAKISSMTGDNDGVFILDKISHRPTRTHTDKIHYRWPSAVGC